MKLSKQFHVFIPGFGNPFLKEKYTILKNNLRVIKTYPYTYSVTICVYEENKEVIDVLKNIIQDLNANSCDKLIDIQIIHEKGIVGQFIKKYASPHHIKEKGYDYIMLLLDDVELIESSWSWDKLINDYERNHIDIASPTMTHDSKYLFPFMLTRSNSKHMMSSPDIISVTSACEFFCYFMNLENYKRYYQEIDENHPWMWGIDLLLRKHLGFKVGMMHSLQMKHYFQNSSTYDESRLEVFEKMSNYLSKYGETQQSLALQPAIFEEIIIYHRS